MYLISIMFLVIIPQSCLIQSSSSISNYGPYKVSVKSWQFCQGPKPRNVTEWMIQNTEQIAHVRLTFTEDSYVERVRISVYTTSYDVKHRLWEYKVNKPCEHVVFKTVIKNRFYSGPGCFFKKGHYRVTINATEVANTFLGTQFFYGSMLYKVTAQSKNGNVMCFNCQGPYILNLKSFEFCRGPKVNNITECAITTLLMEHNTCVFNITFAEDSRVDMARVGVYTKSYSSDNLLWHYRTNTPCQHVLYTGLLQKIFKVGRSCIFKKGTYPIKLNFTQTTRLFHGSSFFYGDMLFKAVATGKKGNIFCLIYNLSYKKKP